MGPMTGWREILGLVAHRRLAKELLENVTEPLWTAGQHWGWCGQNCPCCRTIQQEALGRCAACEAAERASTVAAKIAAFLAEEQCKKSVMKTLTGKLGLPARPLPPRVMFEIEEALSETRGTVLAPAGIAGLSLRGGGDAWQDACERRSALVY